MRTLAVVIGNNSYYKGCELTNAVEDAKAMADVFNRLGYDVILTTDMNADQSFALLQEFDSRIPGYDASIFYFAGHGFQLDGENFLASIECQVATPNKYHCVGTCIMLSQVLDILKKNSNKINIVIIDACRKSFDRGGSSTFTPIHAPKGTLIAFSTSPNEGARDGGFEGHSIYTGALLKYIGRELLSVEELFKKVRKTVFTLTEGQQTTWEHTSLIGDFYFNTGQLIYSVALPYDELVIKDNSFDTAKDEFANLIGEVKSYNWNRQNPAIDKLLALHVENLDKNRQFILGRNLLQASDNAFHASNFFEKLPDGLKKYSKDGENHVLNGILFEIYFDSFGQFRRDKLKTHCFEQVMALRSNSSFAKSFEFIRNGLSPYKDALPWTPGTAERFIDVDVLATSEKYKNILDGEETHEIIIKVNVLGTDITETISSRYGGIVGRDINSLRGAVANFLNAPVKLVQINSNIDIKNISFATGGNDKYLPW